MDRLDYCELSQEQIFDICAIHLLDNDLLVIGIYHSNLTNHNEYLKLFEKLLTKIDNDKVTAIIMGDINIDLLNNTTIKKHLLDILSAHHFRQYVKKATRVDGDSATLLDHAYSNIRDARVSATCVITNLSDHMAQRLVVPQPAPHPRSAIVKKRAFSCNNRSMFVRSLECIDWQIIIDKHQNECELFATKIINILANLQDVHMPVKTVTVHHKKSPWIDSELIGLKLLAFDFIALAKIDPGNTQLNTASTKILNTYNQKLQRKRTEYFNSSIGNSSNKNKAMWRAINTEIARLSRERVDYTDLLTDNDGNPFVSKQHLVDALNEEFITAGAACGAPAPDRAQCLTSLSSRTFHSDTSLRLTSFSPAEISVILSSKIAAKNTTDVYGLSANLLKQASTAICFVLSQLFNNCMRLGSYPTCLKKVKICPLYKGKGDKKDAKSYRPIALVPALSKCFEVGLNTRLLSYWFPRNVLSDSQYAYRQGRSTTDLVREVIHCALRAREAGRQVAIICCDLSRAFDTADHALVADKLGHYGVRGPALKLLLSFMSERAQVVVGDRGSVTSSERHNLMGVPQGSCLSNTLFSILLNDLPAAITGADIYMYADDVTAVVSTPMKNQLETALNNVVRQLNEWFKVNGLALNKNKTCFMTVKLNGHRSESLQVCADDAPIQHTSCTRLLGFHLDSALTWERHIDEVCNRLGRACFALRRLARTAGRAAVRECYFATVHSVLTYGVELWARAADWYRVFSMQKRALRGMAGKPNDAPARELFLEFQILPLPCILIQQVAVFTHTNRDHFKRRGTNSRYPLRSNKYGDRLVAERHTLAKSTKLEPYVEKILSNYQCGFRQNRSTVDQIILLKQIMEKRWEYAQPVHVVFVDFAKAYDSIDRDSLYAILRNFNIPNKLVTMRPQRG
ncbi:uncharacterized protein LOC133527116 [Cydia pomonella]|uniref:uncharacterized protein LOC133527116 n=1 Tax=Cydia pomonella TaxID=82600 RepID=UPI002ADE36B4|nr:uncharacterized protein LOC133527116 [Cydia pomonella]